MPSYSFRLLKSYSSQLEKAQVILGTTLGVIKMKDMNLETI
jgi:hypothetical protein